ncbi:MAG: hypothetical protein Q9191_000747 [Dirinaria sp. TL-2023a]
MKSVRRKSPSRRASLKIREERWSVDDLDLVQADDASVKRRRKSTRHSKSSSKSSSSIATAVKSATTSLVAPHSKRSNGARRSQRNNKLNAANKFSSDSTREPIHVVDEVAWDRARQRRSILEELTISEESYVADLKVLVNVYLPLIQSAAVVSQGTWVEIHRNVHEILTLHEDIVLRLRRILPELELSSSKHIQLGPRSRHNQSKSEDRSQGMIIQTAVPIARQSVNNSRPDRSKNQILTSEPHESADVARVFDRVMPRFFVYEEYGAKYESMLCDMAATSKQIPIWQAYERSIEAMAHSLVPSHGHESGNRKGLTFEDLLIKISGKPIQRVCKYPLLFADLYKYTPALDDPKSRREIEKVLSRLRETAQEINKATNDQEARDRIQRSWHLQDLLTVPDVPTAPLSLRLLGHALLCGVLYLAYQTPNGLRGDFMLCVLFRSYLLIARPCLESPNYNTEALIFLGNVRIEEPCNGRGELKMTLKGNTTVELTLGLQCHTAPYSWKLLFESEYLLYEIMFCACSSQEEEQWKQHIGEYSAKADQRQTEDDLISPLTYAIMELDMKSYGQVFRRKYPLNRRLSIQRAATIPRSSAYHVLIRNTSVPNGHRDRNVSPADSVGRSQSLQSSNRLPSLAPNRTERIRMEHQLANVWTRELLPYPGMTGPRGENLIRSSANSLIRRLSKASISSSFTKRSASTFSHADGRQECIPEKLARPQEITKEKQPKLHGSKSMDLNLGWRNRTLAGSRDPQALRRSTSLASRKLFKSKKVVQRSVAPGIAAMEPWRRSPEVSSIETIKTKSGTTAGFFGAFSTEGIRAWINPNR